MYKYVHRVSAGRRMEAMDACVLLGRHAHKRAIGMRDMRVEVTNVSMPKLSKICGRVCYAQWNYSLYLFMLAQFLDIQHMSRNIKVIFYFSDFHFHTVLWAVKKTLPTTHMHTLPIRFPCFLFCSPMGTYQYVTCYKCTLCIFSLPSPIPFGT